MTAANLAPPPDSLLKSIAYDPATGAFTWIAGQRAGTRAGSKDRAGYTQILHRGRHYRANRLAWFITHGRWPDGIADHVNGDQADDRIENLRDATYGESSRNIRGHGQFKKGVQRVTKGGRFFAQIKAGERTHYLGSFDTEDEAHAAYVAAAQRLHGEFARAS